MRHVLQAGLAAALVTAASAPATAQIRVPGTPAARQSVLPSDVPTVHVPVPDIEAYRLEDQWRIENNVPSALRYGAPVPVAISNESDGRWDVAENGDLVWRVRIESPGSLSLTLELDEYRLPEGAQVFVYDDAVEEVYGAFDHTQNTPSGEMGIWPFPGDSLILEYKQPADVAEVGTISIERVIYDYRDFFELERTMEEDDAPHHVHSGDDGGVTGGCTVSAACSQFDQWPLQKRATIRTVFGGGLCSASLINNTANDGAQLVYTANHCGQGGSTTFRFKYIASSCGGGGAPSTNNVSGATLLANHTSSDGRLMRINPNIPSSYDEYYNGWRRGTANPTFGLSFHHPGGSPMSGMIDNNGGGKATINFSGIGLVSCWVMNSQTGGTQGGSSGSPLFDQNDRTIGTLTGGPASCFTSDYGRFYNFWNATNISQWLDPLGTGAQTLDGFDPQGPPPPTSLSVDTASPSTIDSVVEGGQTVAIGGSGFTDVTQVFVDGVELPNQFPPLWTINSDSSLTILDFPLADNLGAVSVQLSTAADSDSVNVNVQVPATPVLDVRPSSPDFAFTFVPIDVRVGTTPGSIAFICVSPDLVPTDVPGIATLDIGNNLTTLFVLAGPISGAGGWTQSFFDATGVPTGATYHWQAAVYDLTKVPGGFPLLSTLVESNTILF